MTQVSSKTKLIDNKPTVRSYATREKVPRWYLKIQTLSLVRRNPLIPGKSNKSSRATGYGRVDQPQIETGREGIRAQELRLAA